MATLYSTVTAAEALGVNKSTVSRTIAKIGVGQRLGANVVLTRADLTKLRKAIDSAKPGNPNFVPGNRFGKPPKKAKKSP